MVESTPNKIRILVLATYVIRREKSEKFVLFVSGVTQNEFYIDSWSSMI